MEKLIYNLANTNHQNYLYYKTSPLCPGYTTKEEIFAHVLTCSTPATAQYWKEQLCTLQTA